MANTLVTVAEVAKFWHNTTVNAIHDAYPLVPIDSPDFHNLMHKFMASCFAAVSAEGIKKTDKDGFILEQCK